MASVLSVLIVSFYMFHKELMLSKAKSERGMIPKIPK